VKTLFSWLHLSDIHTRSKNPGTGPLVLEELVASIRRSTLARPPKLDAILLTGDCSFSARDAEYTELSALLADLANAVGLTAQDVYVVPGNHDIPRVAVGEALHSLVDEVRRGAVPLDAALGEEQRGRLLASRMAPFLRFAKQFAPVWNSAKPLSDIAWVRSLEGAAGKIRLVGLNTALLANDDLDNKQLHLGSLQLDLAFTNLSPGETVIVLGHHPLGWMADETDIAPWIESRAHLHLTGHVHIPRVQRLVTGAGMELTSVSAGASFDGHAGPFRFGFSFGSIAGNAAGKRDLKVWPWAFSPHTSRFEPDASGLPPGKQLISVPLRDVLPVTQAMPPTSARSDPESVPNQRQISRPVGQYRPPLAVYVVWHPRFQEGVAVANDIYTLLHGDPLAPFSRRLGIPVFFRSVPTNNSSTLPLPIDSDTAEKTVVIALVDDALMANLDGEGWRNYLGSIASRLPRAHFIGLTWATSYPTFKRPPNLSWGLLNGLPLGDRRIAVRQKILFSLSSLLIGGKKPRLTVFLSHATADAGERARTLREMLAGRFPVDVFFDKLDIPTGDDFARLIKETIRPAQAQGAVAFVALMSDLYASRDWCQKEVLLAKQARCPMMAVHMLSVGEERSFPYAGNFPSVVWSGLGLSDEERVDALAERLVGLVLQDRYLQMHLSALCHLHELEAQVLSRPPELLDFQDSPSHRVVVYPDPPLSAAELRLFDHLRIKLLTPTQMP
jgi:predicted MPP superfamily phosphohydrolase